MKGRRNVWSLVAATGLLAAMTTGGTASAGNAGNPKPVVVTNGTDQAIPVDIQGSTENLGTVNVGNTPLPVRGEVEIANDSLPVTGDVNVTNSSIPITGTVEVENLPTVQDVRVTNPGTAPVLRRGVLNAGEFQTESLPQNVVLTDLLGWGEGCRLEIRDGNTGDLMLVLFVGEDFSHHLESGLRGPLQLWFYGADCLGWLIWTGYEV